MQTTCCIVGGGPAGVMLGYLMARAGVRVTVLEKHKDFFRDFRGDTVHPSTMQLMKELGLLGDFLEQPHQCVDTIRGVYGGYEFTVATLKGLPIETPYIALMPQWDFLNFLTSKARAYPEFKLLLEHEATGLIESMGHVRGVVAQTPRGEVRIEADLVVACDGRHSRMRRQSALLLDEIGAPIDVLWFSISRRPDDPVRNVMGNVNYGRMLILLDRGNYFQAGLIIRKGAFDEIRQQGLEQLRQSIADVVPLLRDRVQELKDWNQIKLLTVQVNRLREWWKPGLLCIGDAAHAMSPVFGVGINLAIQDAVCTANTLADALHERRSTDTLLAKVQERRSFPTRGTQRMQVVVHAGLQKIFRQKGRMRPPLLLKLITHLPFLKSMLARTVGMGLRREHVHTPDVHKGQQPETRLAA